MGRILTVENLPDVVRDDAKRAEYARRAFINEDWVRRKNPSSRSFCGIPVEVKGKRWGVVVVDSTQETLPRNVNTYAEMVCAILGRLLERG